jgi:hypothetical protein
MKAAIVSMMTNNKEQELHEMLRSAEIPDAIREEWAVKTITRAIGRGRKKAVPLAWLEWADKWESGEDRTEEAAKAASKEGWRHTEARYFGRIAGHAAEAAGWLVNTEPVLYTFYSNRYVNISGSCLRCADWSVTWVNNNNVSRRIMDAEITKQLDDLLALIEDYTEEESISVKLFNAAETELERAVARIAGERGEDCLDFIKDVLSGGCINGTVRGLIYTADCVAFYRKHKKDIQKLVADSMSACGEDSMRDWFGVKFDCEDPFCEEDENQNLLAWFGFEETLRTLAERIELDI